MGGALGRLRLRHPIPCPRFSPYIWRAGGGIFGGENTIAHSMWAVLLKRSASAAKTVPPASPWGLGNSDYAGHWLDRRFSWNVVDGPHNNFGMTRPGPNFAF